ncbi:unnamed protein product [Arctia plantaginis]|uniref:Uncharacterized protein n=1 Tax=Arctia plantaginis TaxID=874455 RepID=A0A8S0YM67_ARCPL|nr:unnamed protein product [Arctia plantaginis]
MKLQPCAAVVYYLNITICSDVVYDTELHTLVDGYRCGKPDVQDLGPAAHGQGLQVSPYVPPCVGKIVVFRPLL